MEENNNETIDIGLPDLDPLDLLDDIDEAYAIENNINDSCSPEMKRLINNIDNVLGQSLTFPEETSEFDFDKLVQLTQASAKELRLSKHIEQNEICPLLGIKIPVEDTALDHKHKKKSDPCGPNGDGLVRGVISFRANALEGKITNAWRRQFGFDEAKHPISLPNFLRNLATYLESPPIEQIYVHPTEKLKKPKVNKNQFNLVKRYWVEMYPKRKAPVFPKSGKITEELKGYIDEASRFDQSVKSGVIKKLGVRDKKKIDQFLLANPKVKPPFFGKFITQPINDFMVKHKIS